LGLNSCKGDSASADAKEKQDDLRTALSKINIKK
jgi:hypothetical protein